MADTQTKEVKESNERYELVEVPTQTALVVRDNTNEKIYQQEQILLEILNKLDKIDKNTG